jgi:hypothetical protein
MKATQQQTVTTISNAVRDYVKAHKLQGASIATILTAVKCSNLHFDRKALNQPLMIEVAAAYGVELVAKERGEGFTWDKNNKNKTIARESNNACQCHKEMLGKLFAGSVAQAAEVKISAEAMALLKQLDAMYASYGEMRAVCKEYIDRKTAK